MDELISVKELKDIKLEISGLSKNIKLLSSQFEQMNSVLIQILNNLQLTGDFMEDEAVDLVQNEKILSRLKDLNPKNENNSFLQK
jgi:hypothetical protein